MVGALAGAVGCELGEVFELPNPELPNPPKPLLVLPCCPKPPDDEFCIPLSPPPKLPNPEDELDPELKPEFDA